MFCRKEIHKVITGKLITFNQFFEDFVKPCQIKNGAILAGRWLTENKNEVLTIWHYPSYEEYLKIEERVQKDSLYQQAQAELLKLGDLYSESREDFSQSIAADQSPKQNVTVSGYITNEKGETLLVKTFWRADTWELPGGGVDEGETLDTALRREIFEETGIEVKLCGVSGVYSNGNTVSIVFIGKCIGGELRTSNETQEVRFVKLEPSTVHQYIKRGKFVPRVLDGLKGASVPYESFKVRPYQLIERLTAKHS